LTFEERYILKKISSLHVRSGPGIKYSKIAIFTKKNTATISSSKMNGDTRWVKIEYLLDEEEWKEGWVSYKHLLLKESVISLLINEPYKVKTQNKNGKLNIRKGAGSNFKKLKTLANGTSGISIREVKKVEGIWWVEIYHLGKVIGWVNAQYLDSYSALSHIVLYGDTLKSIARKYGVTWLSIAKLNKILPPYNISAGRVIDIPFEGC
jgi:uncharacterized protein YraI